MQRSLLFILLFLAISDCYAQRPGKRSAVTYDSTKMPHYFAGARLERDSLTASKFLTLTFEIPLTLDDHIHISYPLDSVVLYNDKSEINLSVGMRDTLCLSSATKPFCHFMFIFPLSEAQYECLLSSEISRVKLLRAPEHVYGGWTPEKLPWKWSETIYYLQGEDRKLFRNLQPVSLVDKWGLSHYR